MRLTPLPRCPRPGAVRGPGGRAALLALMILVALPALGALGACQGPRPAGVERKDNAALLEQVLEASGWSAKVRKMPRSVRRTIRTNAFLRRLPAKAREAVEKVFFEVFEPKAFRAEVVRRMQADLRRGRLERLVRTYQEPEVRRMVRLIQETDTGDSKAALKDYAAGLTGGIPGGERGALIARIYKALDYDVLVSDLVMEVTVALIQIVTIASPGVMGKLPADPDQVRAHFMARQLPRIRQGLTLALHFTFRGYSVPELKSLVTLLEQEEMRWFHRSINAAVSETLKASMLQAIGRLKKQLA